MRFYSLCFLCAMLCCGMGCKQSSLANTTPPRLPQLTHLWTSNDLPMPESVVLIDAEPDYLLVSLINGDPTQKDGKGGIAQLDLNGKIIEHDWYKGLDAPKGMAIYGTELWVTDIDRLLVIDIRSRKLLRQISIAGAQFLNDVAIDSHGHVYASDTFTHTIYRLYEGDLEIYAQNITAANGLLPEGKDFIVAANDKLLHINTRKSIITIAEGLFPEADGIQRWSENTYLASSWKGKLYLVDHNKTYLLWDALAEGIYTADILYVPEKNLLLIPGLFNNALHAYQIH